MPKAGTDGCTEEGSRLSNAMPGPIVLPTGNCFRDAYEFVMGWDAVNPQLAAGLEVVHGIALDADGDPFAHGWVESYTGPGYVNVLVTAYLVNGVRQYVPMRPEDFYSFHKIRDTTRYSLADVKREYLRSGDGCLGPWEPRYLALCAEEEDSSGKGEGKT